MLFRGIGRVPQSWRSRLPRRRLRSRWFCASDHDSGDGCFLGACQLSALRAAVLCLAVSLWRPANSRDIWPFAFLRTPAKNRPIKLRRQVGRKSMRPKSAIRIPKQGSPALSGIARLRENDGTYERPRFETQTATQVSVRAQGTRPNRAFHRTSLGKPRSEVAPQN